MWLYYFVVFELYISFTPAMKREIRFQYSCIDKNQMIRKLLFTTVKNKLKKCHQTLCFSISVISTSPFSIYSRRYLSKSILEFIFQKMERYISYDSDFPKGTLITCVKWDVYINIHNSIWIDNLTNAQDSLLSSLCSLYTLN